MYDVYQRKTILLPYMSDINGSQSELNAIHCITFDPQPTCYIPKGPIGGLKSSSTASKSVKKFVSN